jgi:hypothetical protein
VSVSFPRVPGIEAAGTVGTDLPWEVLGALPEMVQTAYGSLTIGLDLKPGQSVGTLGSWPGKWLPGTAALQCVTSHNEATAGSRAATPWQGAARERGAHSEWRVPVNGDGKRAWAGGR